MVSEQQGSNPGQRRVVRRGLLAGVFGLGAAAVLKVTGGAKPAQATSSALLYPAAAGDPVVSNTAFNSTQLVGGSSFNSAYVFRVVSTSTTGPPSYGAIDAWGRGANSRGVNGTGGTGAGSTSSGVVGTGGSSTDSDGSTGIQGVGGGGAFGRRGGGGVLGHGTFGDAGSGIGVQGTSGNYKGVYGVSTSSDGVHGSSTTGVGLRGTSSGFVGLVGISDQNIGLYGYTVAPNMPALYAEHLGASGRIAARFYGDVQVQGTLTATAKNAVVTMADGSEALLYCQEAPEPYFEDFGRGRLLNGQAHVQLEAEYASLIKRDDYMVFLTAGADCNGLYVAQQNANGFDVHEFKGGKSEVSFTYRIVGKRRDIEGKRLARVDPRVKQNIAAMKSQAASKHQGGVAGMANQPIETPLVPMERLPPLAPEPAPQPGVR
jgi:hypothetical protein